MLTNFVLNFLHEHILCLFWFWHIAKGKAICQHIYLLIVVNSNIDKTKLTTFIQL